MNSTPSNPPTATSQVHLDDLMSTDGDRFVRGAYRIVLGREPDPGGLVNYLDQLEAGADKLKLVMELASSSEGRLIGRRLHYRGEPLMTPSDAVGAGPDGQALQVELKRLLALNGAAFVEAAYRLLLSRAPDPGGLEHYSRTMQQADGRMKVLQHIARSDEYRTRGMHRVSMDRWLESQPSASSLLDRFKRALRTLMTESNLEASAHPNRRESLRRGSPDSDLVGPGVHSRSSSGATESAPSRDVDSGTRSRTTSAGPPRAELANLVPPDARHEHRQPSRHAAITIVSKNYFAFASNLAKSYLEFHPDNDFIIVLVDRADGYVTERLANGAEVIEMADLCIPDVPRFIYRYSIMELNTAVKPFALADLFQRRGYETLLYLDPDIRVYQPLVEIYRALDSASIVLIPHMRRPFFDDCFPSDLSILQSGTYNLGFIGLRRGPSSAALLGWWMEKLRQDCVVDIPKGLFVDQKWMDLVPAFFPDTCIIHHSGYNVAYWNLHERSVAQDPQGWSVDGQPLVFFHFSGYVPYAPSTLSKHQNRHDLRYLPDLRRLTDWYASELIEAGYEDSHAWPYSFESLPNGVRLPMDLIPRVVQWSERAGISFPCPISAPDAFCRFLMTRGTVPGRPGVEPLFHILLSLRHDVLSAFPASADNSKDPGFQSWLRNSGSREHRLEDLLAFCASDAGAADLVLETFSRMREVGLDREIEALGQIWTSRQRFEAFVRWLRDEGSRLLGIGPEHAEQIERSSGALRRILHIYFLRPDLQASFPMISEIETLRRFSAWLRENRSGFKLEDADISLFLEFGAARGVLLEQMRLLYQHRGNDQRAEPNLYRIEERRSETNTTLPVEQVRNWLISESAIAPEDHYLHCFGDDDSILQDFTPFILPGLPPRQAYEFAKRVRAGIESRRERSVINIAGYFAAPTGMGESARTNLEILRHTGYSVRTTTLPSLPSMPGGLPTQAAIFGWPAASAGVSISVANADSGESLRNLLPRSFWGKRSIGFWVWETERLPAKFASTARLFDEVWTPSTYSAEAIARTIRLPVKVVPHALPFDVIDRAKPRRARFGLPADRTIFGFAFDPASSVERKNVRGLIESFLASSRPDDCSYLVIKVNGLGHHSYEYEMLRAAARSDRILFFDEPLAREETYDFLASLDVYVSLHRSEGFGLTCAEAMALGLPVIATGYSGNLEFMETDNSLLVPCQVIETDRPYGPYPAGTRWAAPDLEAAGSLMRACLNPEYRRRIGEVAKTSVRTLLDARVIGERVATLLQPHFDDAKIIGPDT